MRPDIDRILNRPLCAAVAILALSQPSLGQEARDSFDLVSEMNKASLVMLVEQGIVDSELGADIANAVTRVISDNAPPGARRSGDYLEIERQLIAVGGPEMSRIHTGRSRQDMLATSNRMFQRDALLAAFERLCASRETLLELAARFPDDVMPAYTWGQQAQPFTMGHFVLAYSEAFERIAARMRESYARVNLSPLGSAALGTSSFPVDRERLAELLGFDGVVENSFGAVHVSPIDVNAELVAITSSNALLIGSFASYVTVQYHDPMPWITIAGSTAGSSIMPQKRNPTELVNLRTAASRALARSQEYLFAAHNVGPGMMDYKRSEAQDALNGLSTLLDDFADLASRLSLDSRRALEEVNADYSTTTELADVLQREGDVPFRVGHHFASELVTYGRRLGVGPLEVPYSDALRIYARAASESGWEDTALPLDEAAFRRSLSAESMVAASRGLGGPQPAEIRRMIDAQRARLAADRRWSEDRTAALGRAAAGLQRAFERLQAQRR